MAESHALLPAEAEARDAEYPALTPALQTPPARLPTCRIFLLTAPFPKMN